MPLALLFNEVAARFEETVTRQLALAMRTLGVLEKWLGLRKSGTERIERMTRAYPVFMFRDEALSVSLHEMQRGALLFAPQRGFFEGMAVAGLAFWDGLGHAVTLTREAHILPDFFATLARAVAAVGDSVQRFVEPDRNLFDPEQRTASDLFGLAVLGWRAIASSTDQITEAGKVLQRAFGGDDGGAQGGGDTSPAQPRTLLQTLDGVDGTLGWITRLLGAALLALPAIGGMIGPLIDAFVIRLKVGILVKLQSFESWLFEQRELVVATLWNMMYYAVIEGTVWLGAVRGIVTAFVSLGADVAVRFTTALLASVATFTAGLVTFWDGVGGIIKSVTTWLASLMDSQVTGVVQELLTTIKEDYEDLEREREALRTGEEPEEEDPWEPRETFDITLGQLLDPTVGPKRKELSDLLLHSADRLAEAYADMLALATLAGAAAGARGGWVGAALGALGGLALSAFLAEKYGGVSDRIGAIRQLGEVLGSFTTTALGIQAPFSGTLADFPDIGAAFVDSPEAVAFALQLDEFRTHIRADIVRVLDVGSMALSLAAEEVRLQAAAAAEVGDRATYVQAGRTADRLTTRLFGDQLEDLRAEHEVSPLTRAFEGWLVGGGFDAVGEVLIRFVDRLGELWARQRSEGTEESMLITPVSGANVIARARDATLVRVRVPELVIRATGHDTTPDLVRTVASRFKGAVEDAYLAGERRIRPVGAGG